MTIDITDCVNVASRFVSRYIHKSRRTCKVHPLKKHAYA